MKKYSMYTSFLLKNLIIHGVSMLYSSPFWGWPCPKNDGAVKGKKSKRLDLKWSCLKDMIVKSQKSC